MVVEAASSITNAHECIQKCFFVQNVETPALAVMMPVLSHSLRDKSTEGKRI